MRRREFITLLGGAATWPLVARAQQPERMRRIGVLMSGAENDVLGQAGLAAFRETLLKLGWTEGRNVDLYVLWADADVERIRDYAAQIVGRAPDVILAISGTVARALRRETARIPIVLAGGGDVVQGGLVTNLAHPEGNVTGFIAIERSLAGKWLELLKALTPNAARVAIVEAPENAGNADYWGVAQRAAQGWNVEITKIEAADDALIERDIGEFAHSPDDALLILPGPSTFAHRAAIVTAAARYRLPAVYPYPVFATSGGLVSYGPDQIDIFRRAAGYVDRILRGEMLSNLPLQLPTKFELVINLKTAKALGLTIPPSLLAIADEVIE
jgi:putative ABC transport system substrate-binding protein